MKTGLGQDAWSVWELNPLSKQYGYGFAEIHSGNRRSHSKSWRYPPNQVMFHQGWSTHEGAPPLKMTPPYSFEGNLMDKSKVSPPVAYWGRAWKHSLHERKFSPSKSSITTSKTWFMLKRPLRYVLCSECAGRPSPFLHYGLVGGVQSGGDTSSFLQEKVKTGVRVYQEGML